MYAKVIEYTSDNHNPKLLRDNIEVMGFWFKDLERKGSYEYHPQGSEWFNRVLKWVEG